MHRLKKVAGTILVIWGAIRYVPDLLESIQATEKYGKWIYFHPKVPRGAGWTIAILVVGVSLIFSDEIKRNSQRWWRSLDKPTDKTEWERKFPERGDHSYSTSESHENPDGSLSFTATTGRQIDRRPQMWDSLATRFKELTSQPIPIWAEWIYTNETKQYEWCVRHPSEVDVKLCVELCKEAGRLLLTEPKFKARFPDISAAFDDADRWLLAVYRVAGIGKVRATGSSLTHGVVQTNQCGEIKDLPGASRVLCGMARNGF